MAGFFLGVVDITIMWCDYSSIETTFLMEIMEMAKFNGVWLNGESVQAARQFFADNCDQVIAEIKDGVIQCSRPIEVIEWQEDVKRRSLRGEYDHSPTHMQRAYFIQTGQDVALLP